MKFSSHVDCLPSATKKIKHGCPHSCLMIKLDPICNSMVAPLACSENHKYRAGMNEKLLFSNTTALTDYCIKAIVGIYSMSQSSKGFTLF